MRSSHLVGLAVTLLAPAAARAGCACGAWEWLPVSLNVCLADETGDCDTPLTAAAEAEVSHWRAFVDLWGAAPNARDAARPGDALNSVTLRSVAEIQRLYGAQVAPWVLGVTFAPNVVGLADGNAECPLPGGVVCPVYGDAPGAAPGNDVDVVLVADREFTLDPLRAWASHLAGNGAPEWDVRQVLAHELGHALGLRHESRVPSLMNPYHLEFPGVVAFGDDARAAREHYPAVATGTSDLAVVGFASDAGSLWGVYVETDPHDPLRPGVDRIRVSDFTVTHRGPRPAPGVVTEIRVGGVVAGTLVCDLPADGDCPLLDAAEFVVPAGAGGTVPLSIRVLPNGPEPIASDNELVLGYVNVEGPPSPPDAGPLLPDARVPPPDAGAEPTTPDALAIADTDAQKQDGVGQDARGPAETADAGADPGNLDLDAAPGGGAVPVTHGASKSGGGCTQSPAAAPRSPALLVLAVAALRLGRRRSRTSDAARESRRRLPC
jgi:hypothetical protein